MTHQEEILEVERQLEFAKLEAAIQSNGPFAHHARRKVQCLKRQLAMLHHPSNSRARTIVCIDDDDLDLVGLDN